MNEPIRIRLAAHTDIPAICALQADLEFLWVENVDDTHLLVAFIGNELAGFGSLTPQCNIEMLYTSARPSRTTRW